MDYVPQNLRKSIPFYRSIAFQVLCVVLVPFGAVGVALNQSANRDERVRESYDQVRRFRSELRQVGQMLSLHVADSEVLALRFALTKEPNTRDQFQRQWENISNYLRSIEDVTSAMGDRPRVRKLATDIRKGTQDFAATAGEVFAVASAARANDLTGIRLELTRNIQKLMAESDIIESALFTASEDAMARDSNDANKLIVSMLAATLFCALYVSIRMAKRINAVARRCQEIAEGDGDLTQRFGFSSGDEIGSMTGSFDLFLDKTMNLISTIAAASTQVSDTAGAVSVQSNRVTKSSQALRKNSALEQLAMDRCQIAVVKLDEAMQSSNEHISQTAGLVSEGQQHARQGAEHIEEAFEKIRAAMENTTNIAQQLGAIAHIAHQTKVLSINAAIEASKAGEHGHGFFTVAEEIRTLSESAAKLTNQLSLFIETSSRDASAGSAIAHSAKESLRQMLTTIDDINKRAIESARAHEDQKSHAAEVTEQVRVLTQNMSSNSESVERTAEAAKRLATESLNMQSLTVTLKRTVDQFHLGSEPQALFETPDSTDSTGSDHGRKAA